MSWMLFNKHEILANQNGYVATHVVIYSVLPSKYSVLASKYSVTLVLQLKEKQTTQYHLFMSEGSSFCRTL